MIHSLTASNWYSFRGENSLSLSGGKTVSGDRRFFPFSEEKNIARAAVIFGANASGKTNFLKAFAFLSWFINSSWKELDPDDLIPFFPFLFTDQAVKMAPTHLGITTSDASGNIYSYSLTLNRKQVLFEELGVRKPGDRRKNLLFSRTEESYKRYPGSGFTLRDIPQSMRRKNASFIAAIRHTELPCFDDFLKTVHMPSNVSPGEVVENAFGNQLKALALNDSLRNRVERLLDNCDTGVKLLDIIPVKIKDDPELRRLASIQQKIDEALGRPSKANIMEEEVYLASAVHVVDGHEFRLPLELESNGTQQLVSLLPGILKALETGSTMVYDEIERSIHPLLLPFLLELFYSEDSNPKRAQLLCTCHASELMRELDKVQIALVSKGADQSSDLYKLDDIRSVRNSDNFVAKYLSGAYGGVPEL